MLVNDKTEYIGTPGCQLSPGPCERQLISDERSRSAVGFKPVYIRSRVSRDGCEPLVRIVVAHNSSLARYTASLLVYVLNKHGSSLMSCRLSGTQRLLCNGKAIRRYIENQD